MDIKHKELYETPTTEVVEVLFQGIICESLADATDYPGGNDPFPFFEDLDNLFGI